MKEFQIIGVTGSARTGKSTIGEYLCQEYNFAPISFAAPIKHMIANLLDVSEEWLEENKETVIDDIAATPRKLFQTLGTEWGRWLILPNIWVNIARRNINRIIEAGDYPGVVITDVRFDNEAEWIRGSDGIICQVNRDATQVRPHPSEKGIRLEDGDFVISNNDTINQLKVQIDTMMRFVYD